MNQPRTRMQFAAHVGTLLTLATLGVGLFSTCTSFAVGLRFAIVFADRGEAHILWKYGDYSWDYYLGVGGEFCRPRIEVGWPRLEKSGIIGVSGWKTRDWFLHIPLWLVVVVFAVPTEILGFLSRPTISVPGAAWRLLVRQFLAVNLALLAGMIVSVLASLPWGLLKEQALLEDLLLRVFVPLLLGAIVGILVYRFVLRFRRRPDPGHCQSCGYDLTGNVSGRCPECGEPVAGTSTGVPR